MKKSTVLILFFSLIMANFVFAISNPGAITTFESIGIYWTPPGGLDSKDVLVKYRVDGNDDLPWLDGLPMKHRTIDGTTTELGSYRGSIVNLTPATTYQIKLILDADTKETFTATTWTEVKDLPIGNTIPIGDRSTQYIITSNGSSNGYLVIDGTKADGTKSTINLIDNETKACIEVDGTNAPYPEETIHHVIIRGFKLVGGKHGINLTDCHDIIIDDCEITGWGEVDEHGYKNFGANRDGAVFGKLKGNPSIPETANIERIVVQRCKIHEPRYDSNSWAEEHNGVGTGTWHPAGPQGISLRNTKGNHVFRYNEFYTDSEHMFNDIIGYGTNASYKGSPAFDSDIYCNYLSNCWDDAIEADGANRNVRVWGNYIEDFYVAISNSPTTIGPLYIWGNTTGKSYSPSGSQHGKFGRFIKMATTSGNYPMMQGYTYIFSNTILQPDGKGAGGIGTRKNKNKEIRYCVTLNNILDVRDDNCNSISTDEDNVYLNFDYDLCSSGYPSTNTTKHVVRGNNIIENGVPDYINGAEFDDNNMIANFSLKSSSDGYHDGTRINNFLDMDNPNMGAFQDGQVREYGVNAYLGGSPSQYTLATNVSGSGSISLSPSGGVYNSGTEVTLTATPNSGWQFDNWSGDLSESNNPTTITITSNKSVTANFSEIGGETLIYNAYYSTIVTGVTSSANGGFSEPGYANVDNQNGTYVEWSNVNVNTAGSYNCTIKYASNSNRPGNVEVNGAVATTLQGTSTGNFQTWGAETVTFDLNAGNNTIRLTGTTSSSLGNIDQISLEYVGGGVSEEIEVSVSDDDDDAEENTANGNVDTGSSDLEMAEDGSKTQIIGIRFSGVNIPQGATITNAYIEFKAKGSKSVSTSLTIKGEDINDSPAFVDDSHYTISNRNTTTESKNWNSIQTWDNGLTYQTPNIGDIVEEIVGRSGWNSGNALSVIISGSGVRRAYSHKNGKIPPKLHVEYTTQSVVENDIVVSIASTYDDAEEKGGPVYPTSSGLEMAVNGSTAQTIGLRFNGITIPQGATITDAYIQFTAYGTSTEATSLTIRGENTDDAETFTDTPNSISARPTTSKSVSWDNIVAWNTAGESGVAQQTPSINEIIEDLVGRAGWNSGNSLALIITGSGTRKAYAYSGSHVDEVAELHITYQTLAKEQAGNIEEEVVPTSYTFSNYPNPFNPSTNIAFTLPKSGQIKIVVYDMLGREVSKVVDNFYESGSYNYSWTAKDENGTQLSSGIYIARIQAGNYVKSIKMMLLR